MFTCDFWIFERQNEKTKRGLESILMQSYNLLNRSTGEIFTQKFKNLKQVKDFLKMNKQFEIIEQHFEGLPVRGTRQLS